MSTPTKQLEFSFYYLSDYHQLDGHNKDLLAYPRATHCGSRGISFFLPLSLSSLYACLVLFDCISLCLSLPSFFRHSSSFLNLSPFQHALSRAVIFVQAVSGGLKNRLNGRTETTHARLLSVSACPEGGAKGIYIYCIYTL